MGTEYKSIEDVGYSFRVKEREDNNEFKLEQDVSAYKDYAAKSRELDLLAPSKRQYRSFAIIPDIVAIDMLTRFNLDIHAPDFMDNPANLRKLKHIIMTEYPALQTSNMKGV